MERRRWVQRVARPAALAACLAAVPQIVTCARQVRTGVYPGSAYAPRVETLLRMSASAAEGGPFVAVADGGSWRLAANMVPDLGVPAVLDLWARLTGRAGGVRALGLINLAFLCAALFGLVFAFPENLRWGLVPVFLLFPLSVPLYQSPDTVAIHGALAALAVAAAVLGAHAGSRWTAIASGVMLFALHKVRAIYGLYALLALAAVAGAGYAHRRDRRVAARALVAVAVLAALQLLWVPLLKARENDPRVADRGTLTTHDVYAMLISGVGWSPNRWGIGASDPKVATFIARRLEQTDLPRLDTHEGEMQARRVYVSLWREAPLHLVSLYLARIPGGIADHVVLGLWGAPFWLAAVAAALAASWRRRDAHALAALVAGTTVVACLLGQVVLIDPRFIYAYPLRFLSALTLATAASALVFRRRSDAEDEPPADQGAANSSRG